MDDELVLTLPVHYSDRLAQNVHIHQFPLLNRPLQIPPSAEASGKRITARIKQNARRLEIHVPNDSRPDVWNAERAKELGAARLEDDREKNQESKGKGTDISEPRLAEVRMKSELVPQMGVHMLGIVRDGKLHLHPVHEIHQLRPTMTYLDVLLRKSKQHKNGGDDSDSDDGPPPDPDEPGALPPPPVKKEKKPSGEVREVQVSAKKLEDKGGPQGGVSAARREMLLAIRTEENENWDDLQFRNVTAFESEQAFENLFSQTNEHLECKTNITQFLKSIQGL